MKKITAILMALLMVAVFVPLVSAATLNLVTKNTQTWNHEGTGLVVLEYNEAGTDFVYDLKGLVTLPNEQYTLMYYVDKKPTGTPESFVNPGVVGQVITTVTSDANGNVAKKGTADILSMPFAIDPNGANGANDGYPGAKVWLVPSNDVVNGINWADMGNFLYEENMDAVDPTIIVTNGVPSHLITYTVATDSKSTNTNANLGVCAVPSIGITASGVEFGKLYAGEFSTTGLEVNINENVEQGCAGKDILVSVTVTPGSWTPPENILTTVDEATKNVMVTTTGVVNFVLKASVGSTVPAGSYTEVITITAVY